ELRVEAAAGAELREIRLEAVKQGGDVGLEGGEVGGVVAAAAGRGGGGRGGIAGRFGTFPEQGRSGVEASGVRRPR
ncbi:hypothetical protein LTR53_016625, partial [Teratosphaeriaceae sp. CCFEE 6253]